MRRSARSLGFLGDQFGQISHVAPAFGGRALRQFDILLEERGEAQRLEAQLQRFIAADRRGAHTHTAAVLSPRSRS